MKRPALSLALALALGAGIPGYAGAGEADVLEVTVVAEGAEHWRFNVTVRHDDTGWDHYADRWEVTAPDGRIFGTRVLHHPHENEQPFTRSLGGVKIPPHIKRVIVRANDSVHGFGGKEVSVDLRR